jgi:hypothetical protein
MRVDDENAEAPDVLVPGRWQRDPDSLGFRLVWACRSGAALFRLNEDANRIGNRADSKNATSHPTIGGRRQQSREPRGGLAEKFRKSRIICIWSY